MTCLANVKVNVEQIGEALPIVQKECELLVNFIHEESEIYDMSYDDDIVYNYMRLKYCEIIKDAIKLAQSG